MCFWSRDKNNMAVVILFRESVTINAGLKTSTVEVYGICGGKRFYDKIFLEKKTVFKSIDIVQICFEAQGVSTGKS